MGRGALLRPERRMDPGGASLLYVDRRRPVPKPTLDFGWFPRGATIALARAVSSVGRAPARQAGGHWFEPSTAHSRKPRKAGLFFSPIAGTRRSGRRGGKALESLLPPVH